MFDPGPDCHNFILDDGVTVEIRITRPEGRELAPAPEPVDPDLMRAAVANVVDMLLAEADRLVEWAISD